MMIVNWKKEFVEKISLNLINIWKKLFFPEIEELPFNLFNEIKKT